MQRHNLHPETGIGWMMVDARESALHEVDGQFVLGRLKTRASARTITLHAFLVRMLSRHLRTRGHWFVSVTRADGNLAR